MRKKNELFNRAFVYYPLSALRSPLSALRSPLSALRSPLSALRSPLSALRSPLSALSLICILFTPFNLQAEEATLNLGFSEGYSNIGAMTSYEGIEKLTSKNEEVMRISLIAATVLATINNPEVFEHGGGCRKNSPPGQCCHMEHKTGIVHCH